MPTDPGAARQIDVKASDGSITVDTITVDSNGSRKRAEVTAGTAAEPADAQRLVRPTAGQVTLGTSASLSEQGQLGRCLRGRRSDRRTGCVLGAGPPPPGRSRPTPCTSASRRTVSADPVLVRLRRVGAGAVELCVAGEQVGSLPPEPGLPPLPGAGPQVQHDRGDRGRRRPARDRRARSRRAARRESVRNGSTGAISTPQACRGR